MKNPFVALNRKNFWDSRISVYPHEYLTLRLAIFDFNEADTHAGLR